MAAARPLPGQDAREARSFLHAVYGGKGDEYRVVLWELAGRRSSSFTDLDAAAAWAAGRRDTYVHVGLVTADPQPHERPSASDIGALVGLWADLDVADPVHKKRGLPPDEATALSLAEATGLRPTVVVRSGHGLQCWWLFAEPLELGSELERRDAAILARAWDVSLRERAGRAGYTLDAVGDLARLLRVPGTLNAKAEPVPVTLLRIDAACRITRDAAEAALTEGAWQQAEREVSGRGGQHTPSEGDLVLNPGAEPPWDKLDALRDAEGEFDRAWRRKRKDLASPSEYDLSLARYAAMAGWSRQEIANLLIAARRKHGDDLKLRQDYYGHTIDKATADREDRERVQDAVVQAEEIRQAPAEDIDREAVLARISAALGIEITRITRDRSEPPVFTLETTSGGGSLGGIGTLADNHKFRLKVAELTNVFPRRLKNAEWDPIAQALLRCAELLEEVAETTIRGRIETYVSLYLGTHAPRRLADLSDRDRELLAHNLTAFIGTDGRTRIFSTGFRRWLIADQHESKLTPQELASMLRAYGAESETVHFKTATGRTTRTVWALPSRDDQESRGG